MPESLAHNHSIFEQPWWLDAVAPNQWDAVEIEEGGQVVARLPFVFKKRYGMRLITQAPLTPTLGPWIEQTPTVQSEKIAREKDLFTKLINKLPKHDLFAQNFHPNVTNWLPFYWKGFSQTTRYTYVLDGLRDSTGLLQNLGKSTRKNIRKAANAVEVQKNAEITDILDMASLSFKRQGMRLPYERALLERIDEAISTHGKKVSLTAVDEYERVHSAVYAVGDERRVYSLVSGNDPYLRKSQSGLLLRWEAIREAAKFTDVYDFEGSMIEGVEEFFRKFGSTQTPYFRITKSNRRASAAMSLQSILRK